METNPEPKNEASEVEEAVDILVSDTASGEEPQEDVPEPTPAVIDNYAPGPDAVEYTNKIGTFYLERGILRNKKGKRVKASEITKKGGLLDTKKKAEMRKNGGGLQVERLAPRKLSVQDIVPAASGEVEQPIAATEKAKDTE